MGALLTALEADSAPDTGAESLRKESTVSFTQLKVADVTAVRSLIQKYINRRAAMVSDQLRSAMAGRFAWPLSADDALLIYPNYSDDQREEELADQLAGAVAALRMFVLGDVFAQAYLVTADTKWNARSVALLGDPQHPGGIGDAQDTLNAVKRSLDSAFKNYRGDSPAPPQSRSAAVSYSW